MTDTEWTKEYIEHRDRAAREYAGPPDDHTRFHEDMAYRAGANFGAAYERERAKYLVCVVKRVIEDAGGDCYCDKEPGFCRGCEAEQALAKCGA